jgi:hypothetical protein
MRAPRFVLAFVLVGSFVTSGPPASDVAGAQPASLPTPEQFFGFRLGADTKLARWDRMLEYFRLVATASDRVRMRELGQSTEGRPFVVLEIASPDTLKRADYYRGLERRLYFQDGEPTATRSSSRARRWSSSLAACTRPRSGRLRWRWNSSTASRPTRPRACVTSWRT